MSQSSVGTDAFGTHLYGGGEADGTSEDFVSLASRHSFRLTCDGLFVDVGYALRSDDAIDRNGFARAYSHGHAWLNQLQWHTACLLAHDERCLTRGQVEERPQGSSGRGGGALL